MLRFLQIKELFTGQQHKRMRESMTEELNQKLRNAAEQGDAGKVSALLKEGADVNAIDDAENTALMKAVSKGHTDIAKLLIDAGANVNAKTSFSDGFRTALHKAARKNPSAIPLLLKAGANVNETDRWMLTPLHTAVLWAPEGAAFLLEAPNVNVNAQNVNGETPLICAIRYKRASLVPALLAAGADVRIRDTYGDFGWLPIIWAVHDLPETVPLLLSRSIRDLGDICNLIGVTRMYKEQTGKDLLKEALIISKQMDKLLACGTDECVQKLETCSDFLRQFVASNAFEEMLTHKSHADCVKMYSRFTKLIPEGKKPVIRSIITRKRLENVRQGR